MSKERFFVDERVGCVAVRDRKHPEYDPDYNGLHCDTPDVVFYDHGTRNNDEWTVSTRSVVQANEICKHLNESIQKEQDEFAEGFGVWCEDLIIRNHEETVRQYVRRLIQEYRKTLKK